MIRYVFVFFFECVRIKNISIFFKFQDSLTIHLGATVRNFRVLHDTIKVEGYSGPDIYLYDIPAETTVIWIEFDFADYFLSNQVYVDTQELPTKSSI